LLIMMDENMTNVMTVIWATFQTYGVMSEYLTFKFKSMEYIKHKNPNLMGLVMASSFCVRHWFLWLWIFSSLSYKIRDTY
jgi:hypothetical protein